jgi:hypothetical protein
VAISFAGAARHSVSRTHDATLLSSFSPSFHLRVKHFSIRSGGHSHHRECVHAGVTHNSQFPSRNIMHFDDNSRGLRQNGSRSLVFGMPRRLLRCMRFLLNREEGQAVNPACPSFPLWIVLLRALAYCFLFTNCSPVSVMLSRSAWMVNTAPPISPPDSAVLVWPLFGATPSCV